MLPMYPKKRQRMLSKVKTWAEKKAGVLISPGRVSAILVKYKGIFGENNFILRQAGDTEVGEMFSTQAGAHLAWRSGAKGQLMGVKVEEVKG